MRLDEIEARWKATTEGEWGYDERTGAAAVYAGEHRNCFMDWDTSDWVIYYRIPFSGYGERMPDEQRLADMRFVAAAHDDVPYLIAKVRELENPWIPASNPPEHPCKAFMLTERGDVWTGHAAKLPSGKGLFIEDFRQAELENVTHYMLRPADPVGEE